MLNMADVQVPDDVKAILPAMKAKEHKDLRELVALCRIAGVLGGPIASLSMYRELSQTMGLTVMAEGGEAPKFELYDQHGNLRGTFDGEKALRMAKAVALLQEKMVKEGVEVWRTTDIVAAVVTQVFMGVLLSSPVDLSPDATA